MPTGLRWERMLNTNGQVYRRYETSTGETVAIHAPIWFKEDFIIPVLSAPETDTYMAVIETGTSVTVTAQTDAAGANGAIQCHLTNNDEDQAAVYYGGDDHRFNVGGTTTNKCAGFEARIKWADGGGASMAGIQLFVGLMGDTPTLTAAAGWEDATECVGFLIGQDPEDNADDLSIFCFSDDTDTATITDSATDIVDDTWIILRLDLSDKGQVKFYINNVLVAAAAAADHDFSTLVAGTEAVMQPVIGAIKHADEGNGKYGDLYCDYYQFWATR